MKARGVEVELHQHEEAQLMYASSGTLQIHTRSGCWLVPPQLAVWVPAHVLHKIDVLSDVHVCIVYYQAIAARTWAPAQALNRTFALGVTPLLRELIFAAVKPDNSSEKSELLVKLILNELNDITDAPTFLPLPSSPVGKRVADLAIRYQEIQMDVAELARQAGTSVRNISRVFPAETGLTFKSWRQRARIVLSIEQLSGKVPVARVAAKVGFSSTAAFSYAFRQIIGMTPSEFMERNALIKNPQKQ
ncbi:hypothetical protein AO390_04070 [Pseudomonas marginalis ICMP 11289]|nr:hypothetical protein AO390_04070 [Pseudomonas marginalis ICMP 11289]